VPPGLSRRVSELASRDATEAWLIELWETTKSSTKAPASDLQSAMTAGLLSVATGHPSIVESIDHRVTQQLAANRYVGTGVRLGWSNEEKVAVIDLPFPRGPARRAGAKPGDRIVAINDTSVEGTSLQKVVEHLRGDEGSRVRVSVRQPGSTDVRRLDIVRGTVPIDSVHGFRRASEESWDFRIAGAAGIGYVRLNAIVASTLHELRQAARAIENQDLKALVIDLRSHMGAATLEHAMLVGDELLEEGLIGSIRGADGAVRPFPSRPDSLFRQLPIVLLIDHRTAGDPEFIAAALQDQKRAVVVGEPSAGDGYIRSSYELPDELGTLILPSGIWVRPSGRPLARANKSLENGANVRPQVRSRPPAMKPDTGGVQPDHAVTMTDDQRNAWLHWRTAQEQAELPPGTPDTIDDPYLDKAIELLRHELAKRSQP
jgi:carboxyl-terminal processing protease